MRTGACLLLGLLIAPAAAFGQGSPASPLAPGGADRDNQAQQKIATVRLSGRVTAADTGKPLRRAEVVAAPPGLSPGEMQQQIVLTARSTTLSGAVQDGRGRPLTDYAVVAFSPDSSKWGYQTRFVRSGRPNQDGRFELKGLPPGDYLVAALEYLEPGDEGDPEQLEKWKPGSTSVTLGDGEAKSITLKLTR
jgi:hypothetical protein